MGRSVGLRLSLPFPIHHQQPQGQHQRYPKVAGGHVGIFKSRRQSPWRIAARGQNPVNHRHDAHRAAPSPKQLPQPQPHGGQATPHDRLSQGPQVRSMGDQLAEGPKGPKKR